MTCVAGHLRQDVQTRRFAVYGIGVSTWPALLAAVPPPNSGIVAGLSRPDTGMLHTLCSTLCASIMRAHGTVLCKMCVSMACKPAWKTHG
eukprot:356111-Chlamydomonas_euryale.AAC.3